MASRDLYATHKSPKYFSSVSNRSGEKPRLVSLREEGEDLTGIITGKKRTIEATLSAYKLRIGSHSPRLSKSPSTKLPLKPKGTSIKYSPKPTSNSALLEYTKSSPLDSAVIMTRKQGTRGQKERHKPILLGQRAASIPTLLTSELPPFRPITASSSSVSLQNTPKTHTAKQPLFRSADQQLASLVTQVKPVPSSGLATSYSQTLYREHLYQTFLAVKFIKTLPPVNEQQLILKRVLLPRRPGYETKKTLVFDLDETLVHCIDKDNSPGSDVTLPIRFPTGEVVKVIST